MVLPLVPPKSQGVKSATFTQPPLDFSLSFPEICEWNAAHSPAHPLFNFSEGSGRIRTICWAEAVQGFRCAAQHVQKLVGASGGTGAEARVMAILSSSDSISYHTLIVGTLLAGYAVFPISPRNSPAAVAVLLAKTHARDLFVSAEPALHALAESALNQLGADADAGVRTHAMPRFEELYPRNNVDSSYPLAEPMTCPVDLDSLAMIYHSSGTTSFPKPIYFTHRALLVQTAYPCFGEVDFAGVTFGAHGVPYFHGMSLFLVLYTAASGLGVNVFKPHSPATVPNPVNVFENAIATKSDYLFLTPTFIESWARVPEYVRALSSTRGLVTGGGPLNKIVGDYLVSQGVNIYMAYATTESMTLSVVLPAVPSKDWEYFQLSPIRDAHFVDNGNNEYELVVLANEYYRPSVINMTVNGREGYATHDLLMPHPTRKGFWRVVGRTDDQIMHSTGEKTNPGPLENQLCQDPFIDGAIYFGRERFFCGVILQPKPPYAFDPSDRTKVVEFRNRVWPTFERVNEFAPTHSRIFKEMILVASPHKPLLYTVKGTLRRSATLDQYKDEIEAAYAAADSNAQEDIDAPTEWSPSSVKELVKRVVEKTMKTKSGMIEDEVDLFERGLDSLQATWIRNSLLRVLRNNDPTIADKLPSNIVYDNPTISGLSKIISDMLFATHVHGVDEREQKRVRLLELVAKYSSSFPSMTSFTNDVHRASGNVVLLTGSTGSFGSNILAKLIATPSVTRIYALSRSAPDGVAERHRNAFAKEGLDIELLKSEKVELLYGDPSYDDFKMDARKYEEMQSSVTHIIHNGWRVNFNLSVGSFESNIRSVRYLVNFALGKNGGTERPARVIFISSIGVLQNTKERGPAKEVYHDEPEIAAGSGYSESKWISEQILKKASEQTPLRPTIVRCGQLTGGPSGSFNEHEWFPSIVKSSVKLQKLPDTIGSVSWITGYDAANALLDMMYADDDEPVLHLTHPNPVPWSTVMACFSRELGLPVAPYIDWLADLREAHATLNSRTPSAAELERALQDNPALRLMNFFEAAANGVDREDIEPLGVPKLDVTRALQAAPSLKRAEPVGQDHVQRWVQYWKKTGFLS